MIKIGGGFKINAIVRKTITYMFFNALNGLIPFMLLPILTSYLVPADYGKVSLFQTSLQFAIPMVSLSMGFNIDRLFFKVDKERLAHTIGNMLFLLFAMVIAVTVLIGIINQFDLLSFTGLSGIWLLLIPIVVGFTSLNSFNLIILRNLDNAKSYGFWQITLTALNLGLSLLFVIALSYGWEGRALGLVLATILIGILSLYNMYKMNYIKFVFDKNEFLDILKLCFPLLLQGFGVFAIFQSNTYLINIYIGTAAVGIYSVATAFSGIMGIAQDAIVKTINPWFYKNLNDITHESKIKIVKMNILIFLSFIVLAFLIYFASIILIKLMININYQEAISLVLLLSLALAFNGMYKISSVYFIHLSKTKLLSNLTGITAVVSVLLNVFLIKNYNVQGASLALFLGLSFQAIITSVVAQRIFPLPYREVIRTYSTLLISKIR